MSRTGSYERFDRAGAEFPRECQPKNAHGHSSGFKRTELILWRTKKGNGELTREARAPGDSEKESPLVIAPGKSSA
jgi:hypothetical protein